MSTSPSFSSTSKTSISSFPTPSASPSRTSNNTSKPKVDPSARVFIPRHQHPAYRNQQQQKQREPEPGFDQLQQPPQPPLRGPQAPAAPSPFQSQQQHQLGPSTFGPPSFSQHQQQQLPQNQIPPQFISHYNFQPSPNPNHTFFDPNLNNRIPFSPNFYTPHQPLPFHPGPNRNHFSHSPFPGFQNIPNSDSAFGLNLNLNDPNRGPLGPLAFQNQPFLLNNTLLPNPRFNSNSIPDPTCNPSPNPFGTSKNAPSRRSGSSPPGGVTISTKLPKSARKARVRTQSEGEHLSRKQILKKKKKSKKGKRNREALRKRQVQEQKQKQDREQERVREEDGAKTKGKGKKREEVKKDGEEERRRFCELEEEIPIAAVRSEEDRNSQEARQGSVTHWGSDRKSREPCSSPRSSYSCTFGLALQERTREGIGEGEEKGQDLVLRSIDADLSAIAANSSTYNEGEYGKNLSVVSRLDQEQGIGTNEGTNPNFPRDHSIIETNGTADNGGDDIKMSSATSSSYNPGGAGSDRYYSRPGGASASGVGSATSGSGSIDPQKWLNTVNDLSTLKVDQLKNVLRAINATGYGSSLRLTGRKEELVARIRNELAECKDRGKVTKFEAISNAIRDAPSIPMDKWSNPSPAPSGASDYRHPSHSSAAPNYPGSNGGASSPYGSDSSRPWIAVGSSSSPSNGFRPGGSSNVNGGMSSSFNASGAGGSSGGLLGGGGRGGDDLPINFRMSPFYKPIKKVCDPVQMPKAGQNDRRSVSLGITLEDWQRTKLLETRTNSSTAPQYQLRVFCCTDEYYRPPMRPNAQQSQTHPCGAVPIEFPAQCELRLNTHLVNQSTRGIKKQPGTAAPPDLGTVKKSVEFGSPDNALNLNGSAFGGGTSTNRLEVAYANIEKKHFVVVYFCEVTTVDQLIEKVKKGKFRSKEEVLHSIQKANDDEDVMATSQDVSLRCPASFVRMTLPCRSIACNHLQCFEALSFFSMMEQTPTWQCPVCNKHLEWQDLQVDGYTKDILTQTESDDQVDHVTVEADGTWRSADGKWGNSSKKKTGSTEEKKEKANGPVAETKTKKESSSPVNGFALNPSTSSSSDGGSGGNNNNKPKPPTQQVTVIDSDDDEDFSVFRSAPSAPTGDRYLARPIAPLPSRTSSVSGGLSNGIAAVGLGGGSRRGGGSKNKGEVIDLTLDSEDEDDGDDDGVAGVMARNVNVGSDGTGTGSGIGSKRKAEGELVKEGGGGGYPAGRGRLEPW